MLMIDKIKWQPKCVANKGKRIVEIIPAAIIIIPTHAVIIPKRNFPIWTASWHMT